MPLVLALSKRYSAHDGIGEMCADSNRSGLRQFLQHVLACTLRQLGVTIEDIGPVGMLDLHNTATRYLGAPWLDEFIDALSRVSPEFRQHWKGHNVRRKTSGTAVRELLHPELGRLVFTVAGFQVSGDPDMQCCIFTTVPNSETAAKLYQRLHEPALLLG